MTDRSDERDADRAEPSTLGAASTLPFERRRRSDRKAGRRRRRRPEEVPAGHGSLEDSAPVLTTSEPPRYSGVEYVFEPHASSVPALRQYIRAAWERRRFMRELARAENQKSRENTVLGGLWGIVDPLLLSGIYILVFTIIREGQRPTEFIPVLIAGVMLFQLSSSMLNDGATSISGSKSLLLNSTFPRVVLPATYVYKAIVKFGPVVPVYALIFVVMPTEPGWGLLLLPVLFVIQIVLGFGMAMLAATLVVYFRDVKNLLTYVTRLFFFTTPVIWPIAFLPEDMRAVLAWQPFFALFAGYQEIFSGGTPGIGTFVQSGAWALGFLVVGAWAFRRREGDFANHL